MSREEQEWARKQESARRRCYHDLCEALGVEPDSTCHSSALDRVRDLVGEVGSFRGRAQEAEATLERREAEIKEQAALIGELRAVVAAQRGRPARGDLERALGRMRAAEEALQIAEGAVVRRDEEIEALRSTHAQTIGYLREARGRNERLGELVDELKETIVKIARRLK